MADSPGKKIKKQMSQKQASNKDSKWEPVHLEDGFSVLDAISTKEFVDNWDPSKLTESDRGYDLMEIATEGLRKHGLPEESKRQLRKQIGSEHGQKKLHEMMNMWSKENLDKPFPKSEMPSFDGLKNAKEKKSNPVKSNDDV